MPASHRSADETLRMLRIIAGALLLSTVIYVGVAFTVAPQQQGADPASLTTLRLGLVAAALSTLAAIPVLRRLLMGKIALMGGAAPLHGDQGPSKAALASAAARLQVGTIVGMALAEAVVLYGFVLAFLSGEAGQILPFFVAGFLAMAVQFPRRSQVDAVAAG